MPVATHVATSRALSFPSLLQRRELRGWGACPDRHVDTWYDYRLAHDWRRTPQSGIQQLERRDPEERESPSVIGEEKRTTEVQDPATFRLRAVSDATEDLRP